MIMAKHQAMKFFANLADIGRLMRIQPGEAQGYRLFLDDPFQITELPTYFKESSYQRFGVSKREFFQAVRMEKNMMGLLISLNYRCCDFQYCDLIKFNGGR